MAPHDPQAALLLAAQAEAHNASEKTLLRRLLDDVPAEDIETYGARDLAALAAGRLAFLNERRPGRAKIEVSNPGGVFSDVTFVDIANDDMPFLVDSVLGLFNEKNLEVRLALHPILTVKRDALGKLEWISDKPGPGANAMRESLIHVHVAHIRAEEERKELQTEIQDVLADVRIAVLDWRAMRKRLKEAVSRYQAEPPPIPIEELTESIAFLQWLIDNHFTFLGVREYAFEGGIEKGELRAIADTGLGLLRNPQCEILRRGDRPTAMTPEIRQFLSEPAALIITKSDLRSTVHRRSALDYVGIKLFDSVGNLSGELRVLGLFTSSAYTQNPNDIPLLRKKLARVVTA